MPRHTHSTSAKWEPIIGYSRAVRVGNHVYIGGTTAFDETGAIVAPNDPYEQAMQCLRNIETALKAVGSRIEDVVRTRMYVTNIDQWQEVGRAHHHFFHAVRPVVTMVEVTRLISPEILLEIEVDAVITSES
jgi:enamine deaminase RidA (YjgF/YER057c/UK114 family)